MIDSRLEDAAYLASTLSVQHLDNKATADRRKVSFHQNPLQVTE